MESEYSATLSPAYNCCDFNCAICVFSHTLRNLNDWTVQLGMTRRHSHAHYGQKIKVKKVIPHPQYNDIVAHDNDIALFQVMMLMRVLLKGFNNIFFLFVCFICIESSQHVSHFTIIYCRCVCLRLIWRNLSLALIVLSLDGERRKIKTVSLNKLQNYFPFPLLRSLFKNWNIFLRTKNISRHSYKSSEHKQRKRRRNKNHEKAKAFSF